MKHAFAFAFLCLFPVPTAAQCVAEILLTNTQGKDLSEVQLKAEKGWNFVSPDKTFQCNAGPIVDVPNSAFKFLKPGARGIYLNCAFLPEQKSIGTIVLANAGERRLNSLDLYAKNQEQRIANLAVTLDCTKNTKTLGASTSDVVTREEADPNKPYR